MLPSGSTVQGPLQKLLTSPCLREAAVEAFAQLLTYRQRWSRVTGTRVVCSLSGCRRNRKAESPEEDDPEGSVHL